MRVALVFLIVGVGLVALLRSRFAGLLLYIWFALFRPQEWVWTDITGYRLSVVIGTLLIGASLMTGIVPVLTHPISVGCLVFLAASLIAQPGAADAAVGWMWLEFLVKLIVVCLFAIRIVNTRQRLVVTIAVIGASFGVRSAKAGLMWLGEGVRFMSGFGGAFVDNNGYAVGTVMIIPFLIAAAQNLNSRVLRKIFWAAVPLSAFAVVSTYSRAGFLALAVCGFTGIMLSGRRLVALAAAVVLIPVALAVAPIQSDYFRRIETIRTFEAVEDDSALGRLHFWRVALDIAADRPLGVGLWNFEAVYDDYDFLDGRYGTGRAVHSSHLQVLTETGWLGAVAWVALLGLVFRVAFRARALARQLPPDEAAYARSIANAFIASTISFVIGGATISMALNEVTWFTFALVASFDRLVTSPARLRNAQEFETQNTAYLPAVPSAARAAEPLLPHRPWLPRRQPQGGRV